MTQHNFENDNKYHERSVQAGRVPLLAWWLIFSFLPYR